MELFHIFHIEAARRLPRLPLDHPCARLHGHSFRVEVRVTGPLDPALDWVLDFALIETACQSVRATLDHRTLNEIEGLENPTSERLAHWIWTHLVTELPGLSEIRIQETDHSGCIYRGPNRCSFGL